jgi:hypothetical protein
MVGRIFSSLNVFPSPPPPVNGRRNEISTRPTFHITQHASRLYSCRPVYRLCAHTNMYMINGRIRMQAKRTMKLCQRGETAVRYKPYDLIRKMCLKIVFIDEKINKNENPSGDIFLSVYLFTDSYVAFRAFWKSLQWLYEPYNLWVQNFFLNTTYKTCTRYVRYGLRPPFVATLSICTTMVKTCWNNVVGIKIVLPTNRPLTYGSLQDRLVL